MGRPTIYSDIARFTLRTHTATKALLQEVADETNRTLNQTINETLEDYLKDYYKKDIKDTGEKKERSGMLESDGIKHEAKIIAFSNNKGGVAKTTTCTALAVLMGKRQKRVLVIDIDIQRNASDLMGYNSCSEVATVKDYLTAFFDGGKKQPVQNFIHSTEYKNIDVIVSDPGMQHSFESTFLQTCSERGDLIGHLFNDIRKLGIYDYVLVDTQPSMGLLVTSTFKCADWVVIPTDADKHGIEGAINVCNFITMRKEDGMIAAKVAGVLFVRADERTALSKAIPAFKSSLIENGIHCFNTFIPQNTDVPKSRMNSKPVTAMYPASKASKKYEALLSELEVIING